MNGVGVSMRRQSLRNDPRGGICCNPMNQNDVKTTLSHRKIVRVLGFPMDVIGYDEAVERVIGWIKGDRHPRILLTVNSSLLVERERDAEFRAACDNVDMSVPDGVPVVWLSKLLGAPLKERIAGVDLMHTLLQRGNDEKLRVYFLGATEEVPEMAISVMTKKNPSAKQSVTHMPICFSSACPRRVRNILLSNVSN